MLSVRAATGVAVAALALIPTFARAQAASVNTALVTMAPVTVSAGCGSSVEELDVSTTVMARERIQCSPKTGVDQFVNHIPGGWRPDIPTGQLHPTGQEIALAGVVDLAEVRAWLDAQKNR